MLSLTKYGFREWFGSGIIVTSAIIILFALRFIFASHLLYVFMLLLFLCWLGIAAFFRDPRRDIPKENDIIVSPADGIIKDITFVDNGEYSSHFGDEQVLMIGIFLSVFDVHINRAPCNLDVKKVVYKQGKFLDARDKRTTKENESNTLFCVGRFGKRSLPLVIKQISGAIAKRIVCEVTKGDELEIGQKFGMIKFGSRTELILPVNKNIELKIKEGDRVYAGVSIIGKITK